MRPAKTRMRPRAGGIFGRVGGKTGGRVARAVAALLAAFSLLAAGPAAAHPHVWIDLQVRVVFDGEGRIAALHQTWRFDPFYSSFAVSGLEKGAGGGPDPAALQEMLAETLVRLEEFGYFTSIEADGQPVSVATPEEAQARMTGTRLVFAFALPLAEPLDPAAGAVAYRIYDSSFYIEMLHRGGLDGVELAEAPAGCRADLQAPAPDAWALQTAVALDTNERPESDLGIAFAETVTVRCG